MIAGVVHRKADPALTNHRPQRTLLGIYNGDLDLNGYVAAQVKILEIHEANFLGKVGHYHFYHELYFVMKGEVIFDLRDLAKKEKQRVILSEGELLLIPAGIAHRAYAAAGTTMIGSSSGPYTWDPPSDHEARFEPIGNLPYGLEEK